MCQLCCAEVVEMSTIHSVRVMIAMFSLIPQWSLEDIRHGIDTCLSLTVYCTGVLCKVKMAENFKIGQ